MSTNSLLYSLCLIILFIHHDKILAQSPASTPAATPTVSPVQAPAQAPVSATKLAPIPAPKQAPAPAPKQAPAPSGPINIVKILKKAGQFKSFLKLLKTTQYDSNLNSQLDNTNNAITIFAPSDAAFSSLKHGTLHKLSHQQKLELVQFHIVPMFISTTQFDTVTNPLKTHAGSGDRFQLNVTTTGSVLNVTTGLTNTTIAGTIYTDDDHLAIYQVDKVLLPLDIFTPKPPVSAPATSPGGKSSEESPDDEDDDSGRKNVSKGTSLFGHFCGLSMILINVMVFGVL